ncbi:MAG: hypothetical protein ACRC7W_01385 [Fusobacteriaceae bacterium]
MNDFVALDEECRSDLSFISKLCSSWNSISYFFEGETETSAQLKFYSDEAPTISIRGAFKNSKELKDLPSSVQSTALLELYPVVISCLSWGDAVF